MRTEIPQSYHDAILNGIKEGEKRMKRRKVLTLAATLAAVICILAVVTVLKVKPAGYNITEGQGAVQAVTVSPASAPEETPEDYVYATNGGRYYHLSEHCSGMEGALKMTLSVAEEMGKLPCPVCCGDESWESEPVPEEAAETYVFATNGGRYYHAIFDCSGMQEATKMPLSQAEEMGKLPCPVCCAQENDVSGPAAEENP